MQLPYLFKPLTHCQNTHQPPIISSKNFRGTQHSLHNPTFPVPSYNCPNILYGKPVVFVTLRSFFECCKMSHPCAVLGPYTETAL